MKEASSRKFPMFLKNCFQKTNVDLGFRKSLLAMLEKLKRSVDGKAFLVLYLEVSNAFDCLDHDFLIMDLNA